MASDLSNPSMNFGKKQADILALVGPSGAGKSTMINRIRKEFPGLFGYSVSHTTRGMRPGEVNGVNYHFVSPQQFVELRESGAFIETSNVHGSMYGTSYEAIKAVSGRGELCCMDLDGKGAMSFKADPAFVTIMVSIVAPNLELLERRLRERNSDPEEKIRTRLGNAPGEMEWIREHAQHFDVNLTNDNVEECYQQFRDVVLRVGFGIETRTR